MEFQRVALLGVGLIGGSLALALKRARPGLHITGFDEPDVLDIALERGAIDTRSASVPAAVEQADLVILATPIGASMTLLETAAPHLRDGAVVTDVGSVKGPVRAQARRVLPQEVTFVGGHPMTGSERRGVANADAMLFENAVYVLCPEAEEDAAFQALSALLEETGSRVLVMDAAKHDEVAARVSHLPQLLAVALVNGIAGDEAAARLAAGGFRDMTRIASSPFSMWRDILVGNEGAILDELGRMTADLQRLRNRLAEGDVDALADSFHQASKIRNAIPANSKGFLNPLSDVFVYTPDRPGALLEIIGSLSDSDVDIKDIELLKIREGTGGTFRLGFKDNASADRAVAQLTSNGLHAYRL